MKRQYRLLAVMFLFAAFPFINAFSNNLAVSNVSYNLGNGTVTFDLSWDNGWRNTGVTPNNWDAAWVFVKYRTCDSLTSSFIHGTLSTNLGNHVFNGTGGGGSSTYEPSKRDGTVGMDDNKGIMLRNAADPVTGTFNARVTLKVTNLPVSGSWDVRVYGIEMVFVPQGSFFVGDGSGPPNNQISNQAFADGPNRYYPGFISSETVSNIYEFSQARCPSSDCVMNANFPKGYNSFYIMKYEISQGQYADFLSAISFNAQTRRFLWGWPLGVTSSGYQRFSIFGTGNALNPYMSRRPDRACNFLGWYDFASYLDWAALRPLTELEYEKACRGNAMSVPYERAWGSYPGTPPPSGGDLSGTEDGTEVVNTAGVNVNAHNGSLTQWNSPGDGYQGPVRCGIFVKSTNTGRVQSGTTFYGVADMTGNVAEYYISVYSGQNNNWTGYPPTTFDGTPGDGSLNAVGEFDVFNWPNIIPLTGPNYNHTYDPNIIRRGGSFSDYLLTQNVYLNVSFRDGWTSSNIQRDEYGGGRGGR